MLTTTGVIKKLDKLNRIVIPISIIDDMRFYNDEIDISVNGDDIILRSIDNIERNYGSIGITRKLDRMNTLKVPIELMKRLSYKKRQEIEILTDRNKIVIRKYNGCCAICGFNMEDMRTIHGKKVCKLCISELV